MLHGEIAGAVVELGWAVGKSQTGAWSEGGVAPT